MKTSATTLVFFLLSLAAYCQNQPDPQNITVKNTRDPEYPKGEEALYKEVLSNVVYTPESKQAYVEGMVELSFDVKPDSSISNCIVLKGVGYGVDEAVKKYVEHLKFSPALQNRIRVKMNVDMSFPVKAH